jgi:hypothetical protein
MLDSRQLQLQLEGELLDEATIFVGDRYTFMGEDGKDVSWPLRDGQTIYVTQKPQRGSYYY